MFAGRRCPARIFFISKGNLAECREGVTGIIPEDRWRLLPNGLDVSRYRPDKSLGRSFRSQHKLGDGLLAGVACAFRSVKQLEHLFLVANRLPADVRIVVAGGPVPDEADYAARLIADAQRELGDRFVHVGYLSDLRGFCNALDIFVNTSQVEACCISVLEAMACGCPVVGYPSKSVDGQVLPGGGAIVAQDDTKALGDELIKWCSDAQLRAAGSQGARKRVEDEFDIRKLSLAVWDEYRDLIGRRNSSLVAASL
jgi:glycosyltransferase involved in cell wall biosynthesis